MIVLTRRYRPQVPLNLAELLLPVAGERFASQRRVGPLLVKIWCAERKASGLMGRWVADRTVLSDLANPNLPDRWELQRLYDAGRLTISAAIVDGEALAVHANIEDFPRVRFLKGYSKRKQADNPARYSLVGRANKALHYLDMAAYHAAGFETYDWGGFNGQPANGIDRFKLLFLGDITSQVHFRGVLPPGARDVAF